MGDRADCINSRCSRAAVILLGGAAAMGMTHAAFSLYWAFGGDWLLSTVGAWAVDYINRAPTTAAFILFGVATVKAFVAVGPLILCRNPRHHIRLLNLGAGIAASVLIIYGGVNTVAALLVLSGVLETDGPIDRDAMIGHAYLWDPLFLAWGLLLATGIFVNARSNRRPAAPPTRRP